MIEESIYKRYMPGVIGPSNNEEPSLWFVFNANRLLVSMAGDRAELPCVQGLKEIGLEPLRIQYLGTLGGCHCYSAEVADMTEAPLNMVYKDLRSLFGLLEDDVFLLAGKAFQVVNWDKNHQYCGKCGSPTRTKEDERAKKCPECGHLNYPVLAPACIVAVIREDKILLAHANHFADKMYSIVAGFVEAGETFEECVKREVKEETGINVKNIKYFGSQPWPFPNSLMIGFTAEYKSGEIKVDGFEIGDAGWFSRDNLPLLPSKISISRALIDWFIDGCKG